VVMELWRELESSKTIAYMPCWDVHFNQKTQILNSI